MHPKLLILLFLTLVATSAQGATTNTGKKTCPNGKHAVTNLACCAFFDLAEDLQTNMSVSIFLYVFLLLIDFKIQFR